MLRTSSLKPSFFLLKSPLHIWHLNQLNIWQTFSFAKENAYQWITNFISGEHWDTHLVQFNKYGDNREGKIKGSKHENLRSIFKIQNPFLHAKCYFWDPFSKSKIHFRMPNAIFEIHFPDPKSVPTSDFWCQNPHFASGFWQHPKLKSESIFEIQILRQHPKC